MLHVVLLVGMLHVHSVLLGGKVLAGLHRQDAVVSNIIGQNTPCSYCYHYCYLLTGWGPHQAHKVQPPHR
jgi:hypothetical protein